MKGESMIDNQKAIIIKANIIFAIADNDEDKQENGESEPCFTKIKRLASEILALLHEDKSCEMCKGKRQVFTPREYDGPIIKPCPKCQSQKIEV